MLSEPDPSNAPVALGVFTLGDLVPREVFQTVALSIRRRWLLYGF